MSEHYNTHAATLPFFSRTAVKKLLFALPLILSVGAGEIDWSQYRPATEPTPVPVLTNPGFERGAEGWKLSDEASVVPGKGSTMSQGLVIERTNPARYTLTSMKVDLMPGIRYNLRAMIRCENVTAKHTGASLCIEHSDKSGKFIELSGSYPLGLRGTSDWTEVRINGHLVPEKAGRSTVTFYLGEGAVGKAYFDDLEITPANAAWSIYPLNASQGRLRSGETLACRIAYGNGEFVGDGTLVQAVFPGVKTVSPVKNGTVMFQFPDGSGTLELRVFDPRSKVILADIGIPLTVGGKQPRVSFDSHGRTLIDGRKFMPVGIYCDIGWQKHVRDFRDAGFNAAMPYNSAHMSFDGHPGYKGITSVLDYCEKNGVKVIFALNGIYPWGAGWAAKGLFGEKNYDRIVANLVKCVRNHPALLAYYAADEVSPQFVPDLNNRKRLINSLDPEHPVWQVHSPGYNTSSLVPFGPSCDVTGIDFYPFRNSASSKLDKIEEKLALGAKAGLPCWFVPQMFNPRRYQPKAPGELRFPTLGEYRAQLLAAAGCGVKGFVFYVYQPLCMPDPKLDGDAAEIKKTIYAGNSLLKEMEAFILSDTSPEKLKITTVSGKVSAWRFRDDYGRERIAVVSMTPGRSTAEFDASAKLASAWGKTKFINGKWRFETDNIDCDLLH